MEDTTKREPILKEVTRLIVGEEVEEMRSRARVILEMARRAVEEGGSAYSNLKVLILHLT